MKIYLNETKIKDAKGKPKALFHTSTCPGGVTRYYPLSHFGSIKAAQTRFITLAQEDMGLPADPDESLKHFIDRTKNDTPLSIFSTQKVYLHMRHPLRIPDILTHDIEHWRGWFFGSYMPVAHYLTPQERKELKVKECYEMHYKQILTEFIFDEPENMQLQNIRKELMAENLFDPTGSDSELRINLKLQRMIRFLEGEGYDGIVYKNTVEDPGHNSYIIFRPEQVFNALELERHPKNFPEIFHEWHITPENNNFLIQKERTFFDTNHMVSPSQRRALYATVYRNRAHRY